MKIKITVSDWGLEEYYGVKKGRVCTVQSLKKSRSRKKYKILAPILYDCNSKGTITQIWISDVECVEVPDPPKKNKSNGDTEKRP